MRKIFVLLILAMFLILNSVNASLAVEKRISLQVNAGYSTFAMTEYNKGVKEANEMLEMLGLGEEVIEELKGGLELFGKIKGKVAQNVYLAAGVGYLRGKNSGSGTIIAEDVYFWGDELIIVGDGEGVASAIPLFAEVIVEIPNSVFSLGGGLGYYFTKAKYEFTIEAAYYDPTVPEWRYATDKEELTLDGDGIGFHLFGEANVPVADFVFLNFKVGYRYTGEIEIEDDLGNNDKLNFNGIAFSGGLGVKF